MGGTHYFVLWQGGGRIFVTSLHFTTKTPMFTLSQPTTGYCTPTHPPSIAGTRDCRWWCIVQFHQHQSNELKWHNCVQQHTAKAHHRNSSGSGSRRNSVGHVPKEISSVCWYFLVRNNTVTCKVSYRQTAAFCNDRKGYSPEDQQFFEHISKRNSSLVITAPPI